MAGAGFLLKRALVSLLLELARAYGLTLGLNRDSKDDVVKAGFRKVIVKVHPDKPGGTIQLWFRADSARPPARLFPASPMTGDAICRCPHHTEYSSFDFTNLDL